MATYAKTHLSGAADGLAVKVAATSSTGTTIHTAVAGTTAGTYHECYLYCVNTSADAVKLTIEWGTTTAADGNIEVTVPPEQGLMQVVPGLILQNSKVITAFCDVANVVCIHGFVNSITA